MEAPAPNSLARLATASAGLTSSMSPSSTGGRQQRRGGGGSSRTHLMLGDRCRLPVDMERRPRDSAPIVRAFTRVAASCRVHKHEEMRYTCQLVLTGAGVGAADIYILYIILYIISCPPEREEDSQAERRSAEPTRPMGCQLHSFKVSLRS